MTVGDLAALAGAVLAIGAAAFVAAAEAALSKMTMSRARHLAEEGRRGGDRLVALLADPQRTLNVLGLLVVFLQVLSVSLLLVVVDRWLGGVAAVAVAVTLGTALLFVVAVVAPKTFAVQRTDEVARVTGGPVRVLRALLAPLASGLVRLGDLLVPGGRRSGGPFVTADELREMIETAASQDEEQRTESAMLRGVMELGDTVVREIMVPRPDMVTVAEDDGLRRSVEVMLDAGHSRVPVFAAGDRNRIVGLLYAKDVLALLSERGSTDGDWHHLLRRPHFVPELASVDQLLRDMQAQAVHLAVVVDEYGDVAGLVTIEDVLEEIVGEIVDEYDTEEPLVTELGTDRWRVDPRLPVDELSQLLGTELPAEEWDSVGGLLYGVLGRVPKAGESAEVESVRLICERVKGQRILSVLVERHVRTEEPVGEPA